jgi:uncharacterized protein YkwD
VGRKFKVTAAFAVAVAVLIAPSAGATGRGRVTAASTRLQVALLGQVNALRAARGLARLRLSPALSLAARRHSAEMARLGFFSHDSAGGGSFSQRIARHYVRRGFRSWSVGENLVWGAPDIGAVQALRLWLASPPHRANLLSPSWREIGFGAVHSTSAPGVYGGRPATIVTADFGARTR